MANSPGQYWQLTKPRVVALIVFTAVIGMFLAMPAPGLPGFVPPWRVLVFGSLGIWLAAASAAAINHLLDQRIDAVMARTSHRPLPTGSLNPRQVLFFAIALGLLSMAMLVVFVNVLCALLTFASLIGYAIVYTGWLKRATVTEWHYEYALLLFLIIFVWTPPHFWALAIFRREDYARAMIPMLPVTHGVTYTRWQILFYTVLLVLVTLLPFITGMSGWFYFGGAFVLGLGFLVHAVRLMNPPSEAYAMKVFGYSIWYLMALFAFLLVDHWLAPAAPPPAAAALEFIQTGH